MLPQVVQTGIVGVSGIQFSVVVVWWRLNPPQSPRIAAWAKGRAQCLGRLPVEAVDGRCRRGLELRCRLDGPGVAVALGRLHVVKDGHAGVVGVENKALAEVQFFKGHRRSPLLW